MRGQSEGFQERMGGYTHMDVDGLPAGGQD